MNNQSLLYCLCLLMFVMTSCKTTLPKGAFNRQLLSSEVDYSNIENWAAHPQKSDEADKVPGSELLADQSDMDVDVFYIHPTTYTGKKGHNQWNASINDTKLNKATDESPIKYQASIFNQVGKVYAPRYRQAHIHAYAKNAWKTQTSKDAFELAYRDVKSSFLFYLKNNNHNRPFIIASHSQGTTHSRKLISELIDGQAIQKQLIAAYIIGMPIEKNEFEYLKPCETSQDTECIISWRTYKQGHYPDEDGKVGDHILVTNPLSWKTDNTFVEKSHNKGAILRNFNKVLDQRVDAQVSNGVLWANKPKFPWSFLFTRDDYHIADMNFYYFNIQDNAKARVQAFLTKKVESDD